MGYVESIRAKVGDELLIVAGVGVFVIDGDKILMQKRKDNMCWGIHGGAIEIGECTEEAARRELFEESGLVAKQLELLGVFSGKDMMYTYPNGDRVQIVSIAYICRDYSGTLLKNSEEVSEFRWFSFCDIPHNVSKPERKQIEFFLNYMGY